MSFENVNCPIHASCLLYPYNCHYEKVGETVKKIELELPESWQFCRLSLVCWLNNGEKTSGEKLPYLDARTLRGKNEKTFLNNGIIVNEGEKVILVDGENSGEVFIVPYRGYMGSTFKILQMVSLINVEFIKIILDYYKDILKESKTGAAIPHLNKQLLKSIIIGVPPIDEQNRIVTQVKQIMQYIDLLENNQNEYADLVETLKKAILQSAIQGTLVEQCEDDEPASILLEKIRTEKKAQLGKKYVESYIYKGDDNRYYEHIGGKSVDITENIPFDLPTNWCWARWGDISESIQYGYNAPAKENGRIKMVRISDIQNGKVVWESVPYCDIDEEEIKNYTLEAGDILFARTGGTVGKSYLVTEVPEEAIYAGYLIRTRYSNQFSSQYLKYFMETNLYWLQLTNGTTATAQPNCNGKTLGKMLLPIPPLAEQERIVSKINEIFAQL